jgi:hypothetical protein
MDSSYFSLRYFRVRFSAAHMTFRLLGSESRFCPLAVAGGQAADSNLCGQSSRSVARVARAVDLAGHRDCAGLHCARKPQSRSFERSGGMENIIRSPAILRRRVVERIAAWGIGDRDNEMTHIC